MQHCCATADESSIRSGSCAFDRFSRISSVFIRVHPLDLRHLWRIRPFLFASFFLCGSATLREIRDFQGRTK